MSIALTNRVNQLEVELKAAKEFYSGALANHALILQQMQKEIELLKKGKKKK